MERKFKLLLIDKAILAKLKEFDQVGCPTPKNEWWCNLLDSSQPTITKHFKMLRENGYIVKVDKWNYKVTDKI
jgi:Mn-dependent DtxR family transcriptional regulator